MRAQSGSGTCAHSLRESLGEVLVHGEIDDVLGLDEVAGDAIDVPSPSASPISMPFSPVQTSPRTCPRSPSADRRGPCARRR